MSAAMPNITEQAIIKAVGDFISGVVDCSVQRGQRNRVPRPGDECVIITPVYGSPLSTNVSTHTDTTKSVARPTRFDVQIDCYGEKSGDRAQTIATLFRDDYACHVLAPSGIQPLYAGDAHQMPLITGEDQFLERWTFEVALQASPVVTVNQDSFESVSVDFVNVEERYPVA